MKKQLCTLVVRREKRKKKHKQSIIGDNLTKQTPNNERTIMHFSCQEREKKEKKCKQSIIDGNSTMIYIHVPHCMEEGTVAYLVRWWMTRFDHRESLAIRSRTHCMGCVSDSKLSLFFFSILFITLLFFFSIF
jgi:hypothetical protein